MDYKLIDHKHLFIVADTRQRKQLGANIATLWAFLIKQLIHSRLLDKYPCIFWRQKEAIVQPCSQSLPLPGETLGTRLAIAYILWK